MCFFFIKDDILKYVGGGVTPRHDYRSISVTQFVQPSSNDKVDRVTAFDTEGMVSTGNLQQAIVTVIALIDV
jgi:hypothetical protein